jgi:energy-coupling factor transporter ATP-binding protein EcfA2
MYLQRAQLTHIKMFEEFVWELPEGTPPAGWHVLLGDNGSGKTTVLRAISLALLGPQRATVLSFKVSFQGYASKGQRGQIVLCLSHNSHEKYPDKFSKGRPSTGPLQIGVSLAHFSNRPDPLKINAKNARDADQYVWSDTADGWFSASFGAHRRFTGGDKDYERLFATEPALARHLTVFGEDVALTEIIQWLRDVVFRLLSGIDFIDEWNSLFDFIDQPGLLPVGMKMLLREGTDEPLAFTTTIHGGKDTTLHELSDGYRSVLSLTLELIRQLVQRFGPDIFETDEDGVVRVVPPGVVLIDEVDVHLHPTWQQRVGQWFTKHFPNIQFIIATHSALVCQAAVKGTIFRLPTPGTEEVAGFIEGDELHKLLYGNILDAYGTEAFGRVTRSEQGRALSKRLAWLNTQMFVRELSAAEQAEREELRAAMPTTKETLPTGEELVEAMQVAQGGVADAVEQAKPRGKKGKKSEEG